MSKIDLYPNEKSGPQNAHVATGTAFSGDKFAQDVTVLGGSITGDFTPSGLRVAMKNTVKLVGDTPTALPTTALSGRNAIVITNRGAQNLYIGNSDVTADLVNGSTTSGFLVEGGNAYNTDIQDDIIVYGVCEAGQSTLVHIHEIA